MTEVNIVTSFNENLLKNTSHYLLSSVKENLEPSIKFTAYYHDCKLDAYSIPDTISYKNLEDVKDYKSFLERYAGHDGTEEGKIPYNAKLDAIKWSHKVFALTEYAFTLAEDKKAGWLIWLDADTYLNKRLTKDDILFLLPEGADIVYNPDDFFFMAFNLNKQSAIDVLADLRGSYILGEVTKYREWHDAYILQRLLTIYEAHGMRVHRTTQMNNYFYHFKGTPDFSKLAIRDAKGERIFALSDEASPDIKPNRYRQIVDLINTYKPKSVIETGTWNGGRAIEMALTAFEYSDTFVYKGYDLFEERLEEFAEHVKVNKNKTFTFELQKGNTRSTLKSQGKYYDMALVGGGNSIETVAHDFHCVKDTPVIILDHYFREDDNKLLPNEAYQGVNKIYESFKGNKKVRKHVLPSGDKVKDGGFTHLMVIIHDKKLPPIPEQLQRVPIIVNPRDCVPKDYIRNNIKDNLKLINKNKFVGKYRNHGDHAIIVSGGHSTNYDELKDILNL
jgi:predicted O-methyltransferase YrrM